MNLCVFCECSLDDGQEVVTLRVKGCQGIAQASEALGSNITTLPGQRVHSKCRLRHCDKRRIQQQIVKRSRDDMASGTSVSLRSGEKSFSFKENCLFCGHIDTFDSKHQKGHQLIPVRTLEFQESIVEHCKNMNNRWSEKVMARISSVHDLPAADAVYHQICSSNFRTGRSIPTIFSSDEDEQPVSKRGRSKDPFQEEAFLRVMTDLQQNDEEQMTVYELIDKMTIYLGDSGSMPFGFTYMKKRIKDHYSDNITIAEINGKSNVVTFTTTASKILHDFHEQSEKNDSTREKMRVIETAAKLIKRDIKSISQCKEYYTTSEEMSAEKAMAFLPESLCTLLQILFPLSSSTKVASLGQAIIQAVRPRALLCPLQLGLGVQLHHHFSSRFLIDSLHTHGFCCSYSEVQHFERSASLCQGSDIPNPTPNQFIQYAATMLTTIKLQSMAETHSMAWE